MELFTNQILAGIATGAIYACMALAVVMIYQAIDHLNFAQGEMAMFSTFVSWQLMQWGVPYWGAFVLTLALSFAGGILIERLLFKPLAKAPILTNVAGFIALFAIINSVAGLIWDFTIKQYPTPFGSSPFLGSQLISTHQAGMIGVTVILLIGLYFFFQFTRIGLAMRAAASLPESARLVGVNTSWMIALGWGMAAAFGVKLARPDLPVVRSSSTASKALRAATGLPARQCAMPRFKCASGQSGRRSRHFSKASTLPLKSPRCRRRNPRRKEASSHSGYFSGRLA